MFSTMIAATKEYIFRVRVPNSLFEVSLCIPVKPCRTLRYNELVHKIQMCLKGMIDDINEYSILIKRNNAFYHVQDDADLYFTTSSDTSFDIELKKISQIGDTRDARRDSAISLDDDLKQCMQGIKQPLPNPIPFNDPFLLPHVQSTVKLPRLSTVIASIDFNFPCFDKHKFMPPLYPRKKKTHIPSPFVCKHIIDPVTGTICHQSFRRSYDLSRHQMIHLKYRPLFHCTHCDRKFTRLDALRRHERIQKHSSRINKNE
ncbi:hypothetical protein BCV72DRAFT_307524 [Rhizopus microsporus var. microsporus]|uniref:C2H2-type domain-containing protein n=2 Tax=Rhizopus microsporus TaxID=58291 RepID=A0A2G4SQ30_RHIZD|nr:uncharacterized protein RHIMIDRAFT_239032 [Rhizopus microsporus ATCC 52813]ORE04247.1 hypothetical protein BCV72DRAFT_307524 [Rhizopus microsporus var. microsporus]PHZ10887.1 hypothetical protein RHIMIDRAFT_239032 [Rhizopus microsporus ATCC 52813]